MYNDESQKIMMELNKSCHHKIIMNHFCHILTVVPQDYNGQFMSPSESGPINRDEQFQLLTVVPLDYDGEEEFLSS